MIADLPHEPMNRIGGISMSKLVSVNVGLPRDIRWKGRTVMTGIFKEPVEGRVALRTLNLDGDRQADLSVHGGRDKAVYAYPSEHYAFWRQELPGTGLQWGMFGENFTTEGWLEEDVNIGDYFQVGSAVVRITQPRMPCYKLGVKFGRRDILKRFLVSGRTGWYFKVVQEGMAGAGDRIELISRQDSSLSVADIIRLYLGETDADEIMKRAARLEALPQDWRDYFATRVATVETRRA